MSPALQIRVIVVLAHNDQCGESEDHSGCQRLASAGRRLHQVVLKDPYTCTHDTDSLTDTLTDTLTDSLTDTLEDTVYSTVPVTV